MGPCGNSGSQSKRNGFLSSNLTGPTNSRFSPTENIALASCLIASKRLVRPAIKQTVSQLAGHVPSPVHKRGCGKRKMREVIEVKS